MLNSIESARQSIEYRHYLEVRESVLKMLNQTVATLDSPSNYWEEELAGFDYILDASPLIIRKLREHCYHLTGLRSYDYRKHHSHQKEAFAQKLDALQQQDDSNLLVTESSLLGGFGHFINGSLVNLDTLKFYESLIALNKAGLLAQFRQRTSRKRVVLEIGAGWGGFAYQLKTLCPDTCYIIIDLPQTLLFSGVYLKTLFPRASVFMYGDKPTNLLSSDYESYDFILLPNFIFREIELPSIDLAINIASFQEMTSAQVDEYVRGLADLGCSHLYSHNRDCSRHNTELSTVSSVIGRYYEISEQKVLDVPYTVLPISNAKGGKKKMGPIMGAKALAQMLLRRNKTHKKWSVYGYRHLVGSLKQRAI